MNSSLSEWWDGCPNTNGGGLLKEGGQGESYYSGLERYLSVGTVSHPGAIDD